jgi:hypothetical protein
MKIQFKVLALAVVVTFPTAAQRSVPIERTVPITGLPGGTPGGQPQVGVGPADLGSRLPTAVSAPDLKSTVYNDAGVQVQTGDVAGEVAGEVVDSGPSDEDRALEFLERNGSRIDPVGSAPILDKMRRIRK